MERQAQGMLAQWHELLLDDVSDARRALRELLDGPLQLTPIDEPTRRGYRFDRAVTFGDPLTGLVLCPCGGLDGRNRRKRPRGASHSVANSLWQQLRRMLDVGRQGRV